MNFNSSHIAKRLVALFLVLFTVLALSVLTSCQKPKMDNNDETSNETSNETSDKTSNDETSDVQPHIQEPPVIPSSESWYCNQFDSIGEAPFSFPEGTPDIKQGYRRYYSYNHFSETDYESFVSNLENSGFELVTMKYSRFLFRDDCMIFMNYSKDKELLTLSWYSRSPYAKDDGEASSLTWYDGKDSLSKIKIHPINVTPEGFYELTGGQMFAIPIYSYDSYRASGREGLMFEDNERYSCSVCFVKDDTVLDTSMESVAVCDVDGDQSNDVLLLSHGPTSGLFTFNVTVVTKDGIYDTIFTTDYYNLGFTNKDGRIVVEGARSDQEQHFFDIVLEKDGEETVVMLYEAGLRLRGRPNTRNFTVLSGKELLLKEGTVKRISVTSQPEGYDYSFSGDDVQSVVNYLSELNLSLKYSEKPDEYYGMTWVISLEYEGGDTLTIYHFGNMFIRTADSSWYRMTYEEASRFGILIGELSK